MIYRVSRYSTQKKKKPGLAVRASHSNYIKSIVLKATSKGFMSTYSKVHSGLNPNYLLTLSCENK